MSKTNSVTKPATLIVDLPDDAPPLGFDPFSESFDWSEVLPDNYWAMESLQERATALGGWPVYTPSHVALQQVIDPTDKDPDLSPKLVMYFKESAPALVLNKSRCQMLSAMTGTRNPALWAKRLTAVSLEVGVYNGKGQIIVTRPDDTADGFDTKPAPKGTAAPMSVDEINDALGLG